MADDMKIELDGDSITMEQSFNLFVSGLGALLVRQLNAAPTAARQRIAREIEAGAQLMVLCEAAPARVRGVLTRRDLATQGEVLWCIERAPDDWPLDDMGPVQGTAH